MDAKAIAKSNLDQALGAWIDYLNQVRINELVAKLASQDGNLQDSRDALRSTVETIGDRIIQTGRGGEKGMHGFIAEVAEVGIGNARKLINGEKPFCEWIDNNGPADIKIDGIEFQMKFVESGGSFSLEAIRCHLKKYPDFLRNGGRYEIPKDFYDAVKTLASMTEEEARKLSRSGDGYSPRQYRMVQDFLQESGITLDDIEPSLLEYDEVQQAAIGETLAREEENLRTVDQSLRDEAYEESLPTIAEGFQAAIVSAGIEGASAFAMALGAKLKEGKSLRELEPEDWSEIANETGLGTLKGGVRGASIYALTNYTATPGAVASSLVTASFGVAEQVNRFRNGEVSEADLYVNAEIVCLDAAVSALSSAIGQAIIPIPVIGAVIGNTVGSIIYQTAKDGLSTKEQQILEEYDRKQKELDDRLSAEYRALVSELSADMSTYMRLLVDAFDPDPHRALVGSCELALELGVSSDEVLDSAEKIDDYFLN